MNNIKFVVVASVLAGPLLPASAGLEGWQYQRKITIQENSGETLIDYQVLVDDFDHETTSAFLEKHGFFDDEMVMACKSFGGKPGSSTTSEMIAKMRRITHSPCRSQYGQRRRTGRRQEHQSPRERVHPDS